MRTLMPLPVMSPSPWLWETARVLARVALKQALQTEFVPALRGAGFRGTFPTWRLVRDGHVAVVHVATEGEGSHGYFQVMTAVVSPAWWAWKHECPHVTIFGSESRCGKEHFTDGVYQRRLRRASIMPASKSWESEWEWEMTLVEDATLVAADMTQSLVTTGMPKLLELMDPEVLLQAVKSGAIDEDLRLDRPGMKDMILAALLSDVGGKDLEQVCRRLDKWAGRDYSDLPLATATWARQRAAALGSPAP
jgi:hypothetical protein